jgi:hypothetical protein
MTPTSRPRGKPSSSHLTTCGDYRCNRPFAVCGGCDRGRRFCSPQCASSSRRSSLQRAGRQYQATDRGRSLHAARQARYRDRLRAVTHQSRDADPKVSSKAAKSTALQIAITPVRQALCLAPDCAFCGRPGVFLRNGSLDRTPRRENQRRRTERPRSVRVRHGHAIRAVCAWAFETTTLGRVGARKSNGHAVRTGGRGVAPMTPSA